MLAVVQWASRAGGSPRLPTRRRPPFFGVSAADAGPAPISPTARNAATTVRKRPLRSISTSGFRFDTGRVWAEFLPTSPACQGDNAGFGSRGMIQPGRRTGGPVHADTHGDSA